MDNKKLKEKKSKMTLPTQQKSEDEEEEYARYKVFLESFGFFEEGLPMQEMRDLFTAVKNSSCSANSPAELEAVMIEDSVSEDEESQPNTAIASSTMIDAILPCSTPSPPTTSRRTAARARATASMSSVSATSSTAASSTGASNSRSISRCALFGNEFEYPASSDDDGLNCLTVEAQVHHTLNWTPDIVNNDRRRQLETERKQAMMSQSAVSGPRRGHLGVTLAEPEDDSDLWDDPDESSDKEEENTNL